MKALYLAWQDPVERTWLPVGKLTFDDEIFRFVYTKGATQSKNFIPFGRMKDIYKEYQSTELFALFVNRLMPESRPEYEEYIEWLGLNKDELDPISLLTRTGGTRETDSLFVYPSPSRSQDGLYRTHFFCHGIRYLPSPSIERVNELKPGDKLFPMRDVLNTRDPNAIALRTDDPMAVIGYCPRYLAEDFGHLLDKCDPDTISVSVDRVNIEAPIQLRLLCQLTSCWPKNFEPCDGELYAPLTKT